MIIRNSSLTVVLLGDWNKMYIQPDWIAQKVYCQKEIELGVIGQGTDLTVNYRSDSIVIAPSQSQMTFTALNMNNDTIERMVSCVNNFLQNATTPILTAYGYNCEFVEDDCNQFADILDTIADNGKIIESGYEIINTKISRSLSKNGTIFNLESSQDGNRTILHFNEHHGTAVTEMPIIEEENIKNFISSAKQLVQALGYDIEEIE